MKKFLSIVWAVLSVMLIFSSCAKKEDIYALPEVPKGEAVITDKKVAKPDEMKLYSDQKALNLSEAATAELWESLDEIFNSGYAENGYYDLVYERDLIELKKSETCLELRYRQKQAREGEEEKNGYFGLLTVLTSGEMRYIGYTESYDEEGNLCLHTNFFEPSVSGQGFAEAYASLLAKIETLKP